MGAMVHDWIFDRSYMVPTKFSFRPSGEHTSGGIPIGWIKEEISYVVEATRIAKYDGTNWGAGGGAVIGLDGKLALSAFGGLSATFSPLTQNSGTVDPPDGDVAFPPLNQSSAGWAFDEECEGVVEAVMGTYRWRGKWTSTIYSYSLGAWSARG